MANKLQEGSKVTRQYLDELERRQWFEIRLRNDDANATRECAKRLKAQREDFDERLKKRRQDHRRR